MNRERRAVLVKAKWLNWVEQLAFFVPPVALIVWALIIDDYPEGHQTLLLPAVVGLIIGTLAFLIRH